MTGSSQLLEQLLDGGHLTEQQANGLLHEWAAGDLPDALAGGLLAALRANGETAEEIRGFATAMRELAIRPPIDSLDTVDVVGTGGDGSGSLNLSTGSALLAAAAGLRVVKHGNRSVSSQSGSADVLAALGLPVPMDGELAARCLEALSFTFLFAPQFHPAMKHIAPVRAAMGVRTLFNILGPLANPARPGYHVIGAFSAEMAELMALTLSGMDPRRAFVVHGEPGWDEATPAGPFLLFDVRAGAVTQRRIDPAELGLPRCSPDDLKGGNAADNAESLRAVLENRDSGPHRDALLLGAGLALEVTGRADSLERGIATAAEALEAGRGQSLLSSMAAFSAAAG